MRASAQLNVGFKDNKILMQNKLEFVCCWITSKLKQLQPILPTPKTYWWRKFGSYIMRIDFAIYIRAFNWISIVGHLTLRPWTHTLTAWRKKKAKPRLIHADLMNSVKSPPKVSTQMTAIPVYCVHFSTIIWNLVSLLFFMYYVHFMWISLKKFWKLIFDINFSHF